MRTLLLTIAVSTLPLVGGSTAHRTAPPVLVPNPNTAPAGSVRDGVLTIDLEATTARWHREGGAPSVKVTDAFAEPGRTPTIPGPLVRIPAGTELRFRVRNRLARSITFYVPTSIVADDSVVVPAGATGDIRTRPNRPGSFLYRAIDGSAAAKQLRIAGAMAGAFVVDSAGGRRPPRDRVFMILMVPDSERMAAAREGDLVTSTRGHFAFTINGRSWPHTERISATVGDTLRWRVINGSQDVHPMHLHGFYYTVNQFEGRFASANGQNVPNRQVVTERMENFSAMTMTWVPVRPGNWLFHCHFALHLMPQPGGAAGVDHENHALTGMNGLAIGINVAPRGNERAVAQSSSRHLRLVAIRDSGFPDSAPSMRFVIEEQGRRVENRGVSPTLYLTRGEPVRITVVNTIGEPTSVHWHGMELESYNDGVAGWSGTPDHLSPSIAPGDSFVALFTPPRSGTFMYHSHVNDTRQQPAGLVGAMIVRDQPEGPRDDDHEFLLMGWRARPNQPGPIEVNGQLNPDTVVLHVGRRERLRFMSLVSFAANATVTLTTRPDSQFKSLSDSTVVRWRPLAKDGADLPEQARVPRAARQIISMGETYDFEYTPTRPGVLRVEVRAPGLQGALLVRVPVKVQ
ncbi:MAG TPA: multicopper oxidase domain-containing protein [Gemmatimonadaceae bacterium]|nr:multicopper oxidase domain-containing protein [Gemmatimonadaceae bacterium]